MSGFVYRASWPILDHDRPMSALKAEAAGQIDAMAEAAGARLVGDVAWCLLHGRLIGEAPAALAPTRRRLARAHHGHITAQVERIRTLADRRMSDAAIAEVLGCSSSAVARVRRKHGIPPGMGSRATLRGDRPEAA